MVDQSGKIKMGQIAPELAEFYNCDQEEFEKYWAYYMEFSPDYFIG
jgi:hypothetical protein